MKQNLFIPTAEQIFSLYCDRMVLKRQNQKIPYMSVNDIQLKENNIKLTVTEKSIEQMCHAKIRPEIVIASNMEYYMKLLPDTYHEHGNPDIPKITYYIIEMGRR
jgi:hypothetical protein